MGLRGWWSIEGIFLIIKRIAFKFGRGGYFVRFKLLTDNSLVALEMADIFFAKPLKIPP
jgi:hypothetical protein